LRALAIIPVVLFHAFPALLSGGFVGVDVFFVISGYLISKIILVENSKGTFSFARFYGRRIRRIFPALIIVLTATLIFGHFILLESELKEITRHVVASTLFFQNFILLSEVDYFARSAELKPLLHLWSLSIEEQFYIFFPILIVALSYYRHRGNIPHLLVGLWVVSFFLGLVVLENNPEDAFYLPHLRAWELLTGGLLATAELRGGGQLLAPSRWTSALSAAGASAVAAAMLVLDKESKFPGLAALLPVVGATAIIAAGPSAFLNRFVLSSRVLIWIGLVSYPLYLWHWPILSYMRVFGGDTPSDLALCVAVAASICAAAITYHLVELPLRRTQFWAKGQRATVTLALMLVGVAVLSLGERVGAFDRFRPQVLLSNGSNFSWDGVFENEACRTRYPKIDGKFCSLSSRNTPTVGLIGDSHAMVFFQGLAPLLHSTGQTLLNLGSSSCLPTFDAPFHSTGMAFRKTQCVDVINESLAEVEFSPSISTVVLAARRFTRTLSPSELTEVEQSYKVTFRRLTAAGKRVVYVLDFPEPQIDPQACVRALVFSPKPECFIALDTARNLRLQQADLIERVASEFADVEVVDPFQVLCAGNSCPVMLGDQSLYIDRDHLSATGSKLVAPQLLRVINGP
jgi:peptidoglycan/LPS O-acetylase OafA/YrhL